LSTFASIRKLILIGTLGLNTHFGFTQCPTSNFIVTDICMGQNVEFQNSSSGATQYLWDFCFDAINATPVVAQTVSISSPFHFFNFMAADNWVGFAPSGSNLVRFDFGVDITSLPSSENLGNIESAFVTPIDIRIIEESGLYYGLLIDFGNSKLFRLEFGNDISSTPMLTDLGNLGQIVSPLSMDYIEVNGSKVIMVGQLDGSVVQISYGSSILDTPLVNKYNVTGGNRINDISLIQICNTIYSFSTNFTNNQITILAFDDGPASNPTSESFVITELDETLGLSAFYTGGEVTVFVQDFNTTGNVVRLDFGSDLSSPPISSNFGNLAGNGSLWGLHIISDASTYHGFSINRSNNQLHQLSFPYVCPASQKNSSDFEPTGISFSTSGVFNISLSAYDNDGNENSIIKSITVTSDTAPDISFSSDGNVCIDNPVAFASVNVSGDITYSWDFDNDGIEDSDLENPTFDYSALGVDDYLVKLTVTNMAGCTNTTTSPITLYNSPMALFDPPVSNLCSNTSLVFTNTSTFDAGSPVSWDWDFGGEGSSTDQSPSFAFASAGNKTVTLTALLANGCSSQSLQIINLQNGPTVDFDWIGNCFVAGQANVSFLNNSETENITFSWDFDDGSPLGNDFEPTHAFSVAGDYVIVLSATNLTGCTTILSKTLSVNDQSLVGFTFGEVIENIPVNFTGQDLTLADDDITSWSWDFDGLGNSTEQNPAYTFGSPGDYNVSLDVSTNQGCNDQIIQTVSINQAEFATIDFTASTPNCLEQTVLLTNTSVNATSYLWDFCLNELENLNSVEEKLNSTNTNIVVGLELVFDGNNWYGFISSRNSNSLIRLDFGNSLLNTPSENDLGTDVTNNNMPGSIRFQKENNNWFGLLSLFNNGKILRLNFGNSLTNIPSTTDLGDIGGWDSIYGIDLVEYENQVLLLVASRTNDFFSMINFGNSILNSPSIDDITTFGIGNSLISHTVNIKILQQENQWYAFTSSLNNDKILKLDFGSDLMGIPTISEIASLDMPTGLRIVKEGDNYQGFVTNLNNGDLVQLSFGNDLGNTPLTTSLGDFSLLSESYGLDIKKNNERWYGYTFGISNNLLHKLNFEEDCGPISINSSNEFNPTSLTYSISGDYLIELTAIAANGNLSVETQSITVTSDTSPDISFSTDGNVCVDIFVAFTSANASGDITTYSWDFNNDGTEDSNEQDPTFQFVSTGDHLVSLLITGDNGCTNAMDSTIAIYPAPTDPVIVLPGGQNCTNTPLNFGNDSDESAYAPGVVSYLWDFDGENTSSDAEPSYAFSSSGPKEVTLTMSIPGCSANVMSAITIEAAPASAFETVNNCFGDAAQFINMTTGENILSQSWDFGDGYSSTSQTPEHIFESADDYQVALTSQNDLGCTNTIVQTVTIDAIPSVDFIAEVGCEGQPVSFTDKSTTSGANLVAWVWDFATLGSATVQNPSFVFDETGAFEVTLIAQSNFGCLDSATKTVTIQPSPIPGIAAIIGCLGEETQFSDITQTLPENPIETWYWEIDGEVFTNQNPTKLFDTPGTFEVALTVQPENLCASIISEPFTIFPLPIIDFTFDGNCDNQFTSFMDISSSESSAIVSRSWQFDNLGNANGAEAAFHFDQPGAYDVTLNVIDGSGCTNATMKSLTINPSPTAAYIVPVDLAPPPFAVQFDNQTLDAASYQWLFGDVDNSSSTDTNPTFTYTEFGQYESKLIATSDFGCSDTVGFDIVAAVPLLDLRLDDLQTNEQNQKIQIFLTVKNNGNWNLADFTVTIDFENQFSVTELVNEPLSRGEEITFPLNFEIPADGKIGFVCISVADNDDTYSDVDLLNNEDCFSIVPKAVVEAPYPNPTQYEVRVNVVIPDDQPIQILIFNTFGEVVFQQSYIDLRQGLNAFFIDIQNFDKGMYFLKVVHGTTETTQKVLKN